MLLPRRPFLALCAAALTPRVALADPAGAPPAAPPPPAPSAPPAFDVRDLQVPGDRALGRRFTLLVPRHLAPGERAPLLVLLHGLGETGDERLGAFAWLERYGLGSSYDRLRRPPLGRASRRKDWTDARLAEVNAALAARPFRGLAIACPYTPNVHKAPNPSAALDGYARWLAEVVLPRARAEAPVFDDAARTSLDGCSLGGFVGIEVFLRRPELFGAWGGVQAAISAHRAPAYADRLAKAVAATGPRDIHLLTSKGDPFHDANTALAAQLAKRSIPHALRVLPGPHDQPWLREAGTIEMLLFHDRRPR
ncbi:alpha/beta hydrolase [Sorangium sp. So ce861]|uniref:alpha/beta hydrolase n=1 Tax=Sorangium sp. So ce861 TaxID=3133323 RepID=UPI003F5DEB25